MQSIRRELLQPRRTRQRRDRKSTRLNSSHSQISYAVFCLKKKKYRPNCGIPQCNYYLTLSGPELNTEISSLFSDSMVGARIQSARSCANLRWQRLQLSLVT